MGHNNSEIGYASLFQSIPQSIDTFNWAGILIFTLLIFYYGWKTPRYGNIPALVGSNFVSSYIKATQFPRKAREWSLAGYEKYKARTYRIPQMGRWHVIVTGNKLVDELRRAPDSVLSIATAFDETMQGKYMLGPTIMSNRYHVAIVRGQLTQNLSRLFTDINDEIINSIEDNFPLTDDWTPVQAYPAALQVVARTSNRVFVGLPLCRDPRYTSLNIRHALEVARGARVLPYFPKILKPLAAQLLTNVPRSIKLAQQHLHPIIEERQRKIDEYGPDYPDKPADFLSWLMDEAVGEERKPESLTNRILHINFAAIHTSSMSFTHALYHLAAEPRYLEPLREEVETIIAEEGWTKAAMSRMRKLDSFFKESQRMNGLGMTSINRTALKEFTFSDGTKVTKGMMISAASTPRHLDSEVYPNPKVFDGFRFSKIREQEGLSTTNQLVATNPDYIAFGHGSHACPGRFFVANEMKVMMAHLILNYDIKMKDEGVRPGNIYEGFTCRPDANAHVLFRKRQI